MSMQLSYRIKRVCGSVYNNGNIVFTPDGHSVLSPVGNRVTVFDLIHHTTTTCPYENKSTIDRIAISHNGVFLVTVDVDGHALLINFPRMIILARIHFKRRVYDIKFSPNDIYFAITHHHGCQIWRTPDTVREFTPLVLCRTIGSHFDDTVCLDWSDDSRSLIMGSKDLHAQVFYNISSKYMSSTTLSGHREGVVGAFFSKSSDEAYTISSGGGVFTWNYILEPKANKSKYDPVDDSYGDESDEGDSDEDDNDDHLPKRSRLMNRSRNGNFKKFNKSGSWKLSERKFLWEGASEVTGVAFNKATGLLVVGYDHGMFGLFEMPGVTNLHRLTISTASINTANINSTGEWLVLGSSTLGQLCVWEWKSETFILKQQGHLRGLNIMEYSKDGQYIGTGGEDGKVKLWNNSSGFCFITFSDHLGPVTGVRFIGQGTSKAVISSSLDGTVRAYDLLRYHNFKTYTSPSLVQFTSLAVDSSGEIVCAGALDPFSIYVWSVQTAQLLDVLTGHEGPIACLEMSSGHGLSVLASGSWDGTMKLWNIYENKNIETMEHGCDVLGLAFRPDGKEVCTCTTNGNITFWDVESGEQVGLIEGRLDIAGGRLSTDAMTAKNSSRGKCFTTVTYSSDGLFILAAGRSKYACIFSVITKVLVKKFQLSYNRSLEGILNELRSDRLVDGISLDNLPEVEPMHSKKAGKGSAHAVTGSSRVDDGSRTVRPEVLTTCIRFSPTGREWAAATTQGLQVFALDNTMIFLPTDLDITITPQTIDATISKQEYGLAINMALQLNEKTVTKRAIDSVPVDSINLVVKSIYPKSIQVLLKHLAEEIVASRHLEYYLRWSWEIIQSHGGLIQVDSMPFMESLRGLIRAMTVHENEIMKLCDSNQFSLSFLEIQLNQRQAALPTSLSDVIEETD